MPQTLNKAVTLTPLEENELLGRNRSNALIAMFNAFVQGKVVLEDPAEILFSDQNIIIKIGKAQTGGSSGGNSSYRGEYSPDGLTTFGSGAFLFGQTVRVSPTNALSTTVAGSLGIIPGVYICVQDNPTDVDTPNHPLSPDGESPFWHWLATWPSVTNGCDSDGNVVQRFTDEQDSNAS
jgi:hypothetical protein